MIRNLISLLLLFLLSAVCESNFTVLLITQKWPFELEHAKTFENHFIESGLEGNFLTTDGSFEKYVGAWSIWPILSKLYEHSHNSQWIFVGEPFTHVDWDKLAELTNGLDSNAEIFYGRALLDRSPVVIHHYDGFQGSELQIAYPDFAAGVLLSRGTLKRIASQAPEHDRNDFTIDSKYEFAKFIYDSTGIAMTNVPEFCLLNNETNCITKYKEPTYSNCGSGISNENVFYAVKTYSGYHTTRVVYIRRTWAKQTKFIEFFSDVNDSAIPAIDLGVVNVERGHCAKTMAILKYFLKNEDFKSIPWIVIADDDTLLNVNQLQRVISCLPTSEKIILGERYGFGYEWDGLAGYDYPTGGSGFVLSREAARILAYNCDCPAPDSPDDMIIGACARRSNTPILHSSAFHQSQRRDYDPLFIQRITPISFHKFEGIDPYKEYADYLLEKPASSSHTEL